MLSLLLGKNHMFCIPILYSMWVLRKENQSKQWGLIFDPLFHKTMKFDYQNSSLRVRFTQNRLQIWGSSFIHELFFLPSQFTFVMCPDVTAKGVIPNWFLVSQRCSMLILGFVFLWIWREWFWPTSAEFHAKFQQVNPISNMLDLFSKRFQNIILVNHR